MFETTFFFLSLINSVQQIARYWVRTLWVEIHKKDHKNIQLTLT